MKRCEHQLSCPRLMQHHRTFNYKPVNPAPTSSPHAIALYCPSAYMPVSGSTESNTLLDDQIMIEIFHTQVSFPFHTTSQDEVQVRVLPCSCKPARLPVGHRLCLCDQLCSRTLTAAQTSAKYVESLQLHLVRRARVFEMRTSKWRAIRPRQAWEDGEVCSCNAHCCYALRRTALAHSQYALQVTSPLELDLCSERDIPRLLDSSHQVPRPTSVSCCLEQAH